LGNKEKKIGNKIKKTIINWLSVAPKTWWHWPGFTEYTAPLQFLVCLLLLYYLIAGGVYQVSVLSTSSLYNKKVTFYQ